MRIFISATIFLFIFVSDKTYSESTYRLLSSWQYIESEQQSLTIFQKSMKLKFPNNFLAIYAPNTVPIEQQFQAVALGIFDILFTKASFHVNMAEAGILLEAFRGRPEQLRHSGLWQDLDRYYNRYELKLLSIINTGNGYHLLLRDRPTDCALKGRRISINGPFSNFVYSLGGTPITRATPVNEQASKRQNIDGFLVPIETSKTLDWSKNVRYRITPTVGSVNYLILMNLEKWNSLSEKHKEKFLAVGISLENKVFDDRKKRLGSTEANLQKNNILPIDFCPTSPEVLEASFTKSILDILSEKERWLLDKFGTSIHSITEASIKN